MGETKKFVNNARWAMVAKIISGGLSFLIVVILGRTLGARSYGVFALTLSVLMFARIVGGSGLGQSTGTHLANLRDGEIDAKTGSFLAAGFLAQAVIALIFSASLWLGADLIASYFKKVQDLGPSLKIGAIVLIFFALAEFAKNCLLGPQRFDYLALITAVEYVGKLIFAVGLVFIGYGVAGALAGYAFSLALAVLVIFIVFLRLGMRWPTLSWPDWRSLVGYSAPLIFTGAGFVIYTELDNIMIGYYMGAKSAGVYSIAINIARAIPFFAAPIGLAAAPVVVKLLHADDGRAPEFVDRLIKYMAAGFFPMAVCLFVFAPTVLASFGREFVVGTASLRVMAFFILSLSLATLIVPILDYLGKAGTRAAWLSVSVSANVILNFLLIPRFGGYGAAVATAVTYTPYVFNNVSVLCRAVGLRTEQVYYNLWRVFAASVASGAAAALTLYWFGSIVLALICGAFLYPSLLLVMGIFSLAEITKVFELGLKVPTPNE